MKVYTVDDWDGIAAVFATRDLAEQYIGDGAEDISEWPVLNELPPGERKNAATYSASGEYLNSGIRTHINVNHHWSTKDKAEELMANPIAKVHHRDDTYRWEISVRGYRTEELARMAVEQIIENIERGHLP